MATRKLVPRADDEGGIGTAILRWASGWIKLLTVLTINKLTITEPTTGATLTIADGKTLTVELNSIVNQDLTTDASPTFAAPIVTSIKASGAEQLKIFTYSQNISAGDAAAHFTDFTVLALTLSKVRSTMCNGNPLGAGIYAVGIADNPERGSYVTVLNTTTVRVRLGTDYVSGNPVNLTIIVAV
jgi:hypothetical protein